jgi:hypothetical protein
MQASVARLREFPLLLLRLACMQDALRCGPNPSPATADGLADAERLLSGFDASDVRWSPPSAMPTAMPTAAVRAAVSAASISAILAAICSASSKFRALSACRRRRRAT